MLLIILGIIFPLAIIAFILSAISEYFCWSISAVLYSIMSVLILATVIIAALIVTLKLFGLIICVLL